MKTHALLLILTLQLFSQDYTTDLNTLSSLGSLDTVPNIYSTDSYYTAGASTTISAGDYKTIFYDAYDYEGNTTKVYSWVQIPDTASAAAPVPGVIVVHGGGGSALEGSASSWLARGYAVITMGLEGQTDQLASQASEADITTYGTVGAWVKHSYPGPARVGNYNDSGKPLADQWMYHSVVDCILAKNLLASLPFVDSSKIGIVGTSWGGIITSTVMGIDNRFAFAIPIYGHGNLQNNFNFYGYALENRAYYLNVWNPNLRLNNATMPSLWHSWTGDAHFPLNVQAQSYHASPGSRVVSHITNMGHSETAAFRRPNVYTFANSVVNDGEPWIQQTGYSKDGNTVTVTFETDTPLLSATLNYGIGSGFCANFETWGEISADSIAQPDSDTWTITATLPDDTRAWFISAKAMSDDPDLDGNGRSDTYNYLEPYLTVSSDYYEINDLSFTQENLSKAHEAITDTSSIDVSLTLIGPGDLTLSAITFENESHAGALQYTEADLPTLATGLTRLEGGVHVPVTIVQSIPISFDNTVANLNEGESATADLVVSWTEIDGEVKSITTPLTVNAIAAKEVTISTDSNWNENAIEEIDSVTINNDAQVSITDTTQINSLAIDSGALSIANSGTFEVEETFTLTSEGTISINESTFILPSDTLSIDGTMTLNTGSLSLPRVAALTLQGDGNLILNNSSLSSSTNLIIDNHIQLENSSLTTPSQLRIFSGGTLEIIGSNVTSQSQTFWGGSSGLMKFVFDEAGISHHYNTVWGYYAAAHVEVEAGDFGGAAGTYLLLKSNSTGNLSTLSDDNITVSGFDELGYNAVITQNISDAYYVELVLTNDEYGTWCESHSIPTNLRHISADADRDGVPNLVEYATGSSPTLNTDRSVELTETNDAPTFRFRKRKTSSLLYTVETSTDMINWAEDPSLSLDTATHDLEYDQITVPLSVEENAPKFLRLKISL